MARDISGNKYSAPKNYEKDYYRLQKMKTTENHSNIEIYIIKRPIKDNTDPNGLNKKIRNMKNDETTLERNNITRRNKLDFADSIYTLMGGLSYK